jgi:hypothetical protein
MRGKQGKMAPHRQQRRLSRRHLIAPPPKSRRRYSSKLGCARKLYGQKTSNRDGVNRRLRRHISPS